MVRMSWRASTSLTLITFAVSSVLLAQSVLGQLGLTDTTARNFLLDEIKSPASSEDRSLPIKHRLQPLNRKILLHDPVEILLRLPVIPSQT